HAVIATLAHACFAGVMGYALGRARFGAGSATRSALIPMLGLLAAVALSGLFRLVEGWVATADMAGATWRGLVYTAVLAAVMFFAVSLLSRRLLAISPFRDSGSEPAEDRPPVGEDRPDAIGSALPVLVAAVALIAVGHIGYRALTAPQLVPFAHDGLTVHRPAGWLPPTPVEFTSTPLLGNDPGRSAMRAEPPFHVALVPARGGLAGIEIRVAGLPRSGNLAANLSFERHLRHGAMYAAESVQEVPIAGVRWLRSRIRYAHRTEAGAPPQLVSAIEYAAVSGARLYTVTFYGTEDSARALAELCAPTLTVRRDTDADGAEDGDGERATALAGAGAIELALPSAETLSNAVRSAAVSVLAVDRRDGWLEPVSAGSGTVVSADG
ncbi:MAG: PrsW family glutamic-type intramembrane protease, partial [Myxococcota bacterium]